LKNKNIIIFSSINWSTHWQIHHQLTNSLINSGNRVLFVENTGVRSPTIGDFGRIRERIRVRLDSLHGFRELSDKTIIYSPVFIPFPYNSIAIFLNKLLIGTSLKSWIEKADFVNCIVISFIPTPSIQQIIKDISPSITLYYCADDMARTLSNPTKMRAFENKMFANSDLTITTSHKIYKRSSLLSKSTHYIPAGVDIDKFVYSLTDELLIDSNSQLNNPIIGYIGALSNVFDINLIVEVANYFPNITIMIIGPPLIDVSIFDKYSNITLLGEIAHDKISGYLNSFDIGLIPYIVNEYTDCVYPCKLNEYLAMGLPIVSTNLYEISLFEEKYPGTVLIGKNTEDFIEKIKNIINNPARKSKAEVINRIQIAEENTWKNRFFEINKLIESSLSYKTEKKINWKDNLLDYYSMKRSKWVKKLIILLSMYFLIFLSPLAWFAGEQLVIRDTPNKTDAIVVFSGTGKTSYNMASYQARAHDAVKIFKEGFADNIYISSGIAQSVSEVEFIRLFLINKGVPENSIHTLIKNPISTYENVVMINKMLDKDKINSITFITSPYHSLRAELSWKKVAPNLDIITPEVIDTPSKEIKWAIGIDKIKIILYEYLAIIHNWFNGRI
jgi:uncharacterized SAM-binding protein YcdF (DUF218 family)/glycosyltransferase involved in cell wall biosynthesis